MSVSAWDSVIIDIPSEEAEGMTELFFSTEILVELTRAARRSINHRRSLETQDRDMDVGS